jgi:hypothetical protein
MPAKIGKIPGKRRLPAETEPAIARFREITAQSANNQLLAEGPAHPDAELLDLCAEALHLMTHAERCTKEWHALPRPSHWDWNWESPEGRAFRSGLDRLSDDRAAAITKSKPIMGRIRKIPAATAAGIYAKALVVRASCTSAPVLAMSLAEDLIRCPGLRVSLWPADTGAAQAQEVGR